MNVLLFEWLTGGGLFHDGLSPESAKEMLAMGRAMVSAVAEDLARFADVDLIWDERLGQPAFGTSQVPDPPVPDPPLTEARGQIRFHSVSSCNTVERGLADLAQTADLILLIAPESQGCLEKLLVRMDSWRSKLISPTLEFVSLTANKNRLAQNLAADGFDYLPNGLSLGSFVKEKAPEGLESFPIVVKPVDGAGSEGVSLVRSREQLDSLIESLAGGKNLHEFRVEQFVKGTAVSVSVIAAPESNLSITLAGNLPAEPDRSAAKSSSLILKPLRQRFDCQPFGNYLGSVDDLEPIQIRRAQNLIGRLLPFLPKTAGYFGVDIVLGEEGPHWDAVIEVNPRLTMSYLELRKIYSGNLAFEMVHRANIRLPD